MPKYIDKKENSDAKSEEKVWYYKWPIEYVTPSLEIYEFLKTRRKDFQKLQEEWIKLQKEFKNDPELAKFCKEEAKYCLKLQRACAFQIPWFGPPDKNQEILRPKMWSVDLAEELDTVSYEILLKFG